MSYQGKDLITRYNNLPYTLKSDHTIENNINEYFVRFWGELLYFYWKQNALTYSLVELRKHERGKIMMLTFHLHVGYNYPNFWGTGGKKNIFTCFK